MNEHPEYKGYHATDGGDIFTPSGNALKPIYVNSTYKTLVRGKRYSYNKFIVECHIKRKLNPDEVVYPKDGNQLNRNISNLGVRSKSQHQRAVMEKRWAK